MDVVSREASCWRAVAVSNVDAGVFVVYSGAAFLLVAFTLIAVR